EADPDPTFGAGRRWPFGRRTLVRVRRRRGRGRGGGSRLDGGGEGVPVGRAERAGDQFEAFAPGELAAPRRPRPTDRLGHGLGVAKIAHGMFLCLNEGGASVACVADPFVRGAKEARRPRYVHHALASEGASSRSYPPVGDAEPGPGGGQGGLVWRRV